MHLHLQVRNPLASISKASLASVVAAVNSANSTYSSTGSYGGELALHTPRWYLSPLRGSHPLTVRLTPLTPSSQELPTRALARRG